MKTWNSIWLLLTILVFRMDIGRSVDSSYENVKSLQESKLSPTRQSTTLRPVEDQSKSLIVHVVFSLVTIVSLDDVKKELVTNGFLGLSWQDERSQWDPSQYGGIYSFIPEPKQIWRPHLLLINTLDERDVFRDEHSHTVVFNDGTVEWVPGGLFHTHCCTDLKMYPFDRQVCSIQLCPTGYTNLSLEFVAEDEMNMDFFSPNPGWELVAKKTSVETIPAGIEESFSCPVFLFELKRRPTLIVLNVILPIILLSFLNNLVFFIPVESGEKISYAVTVLLALSVLLGIISELTPQVTNTVPALTIYMIVLLLLSTLTTGATILTVYLDHVIVVETKEANQRSKQSFYMTCNRMMRVGSASRDLSQLPATLETMCKYHEGAHTETESIQVPAFNKYRMVSKHINKIFFVILKTSWLLATVTYFVYTTA